MGDSFILKKDTELLKDRALYVVGLLWSKDWSIGRNRRNFVERYGDFVESGLRDPQKCRYFAASKQTNKVLRF